MPQPTSNAQGVISCTKERFLELYSVDKALGQGAFGAVMKGTKLGTLEAVAIKMIDKQQAADKVDEEVRVWRLISHPCCVALLEVYDLSAYMALVTEFCAGGSLLDRLSKAKDFMAERQAQRLACELLCALLHMHEIGVAHRDIKPENVLCSLPSQIGGMGATVEQMHVKLADFGLSATFDPEAGGASFCGVVGTAEYMAPELVLELQRLRSPAGRAATAAPSPPQPSHDERVDWWAAGCLLYELLTGKPPFFSTRESVLLRKILTAPLEFPPLAFEHVSAEAQDLIKKLLERNPMKRLSGPAISRQPWVKDLLIAPGVMGNPTWLAEGLPGARDLPRPPAPHHCRRRSPPRLVYPSSPLVNRWLRGGGAAQRQAPQRRRREQPALDPSARRGSEDKPNAHFKQRLP